MKLILRWLPALLATSALFAGETRTWTQSDYSDFEKGVIKNLSVRSDGLLDRIDEAGCDRLRCFECERHPNFGEVGFGRLGFSGEGAAG